MPGFEGAAHLPVHHLAQRAVDLDVAVQIGFESML